MITIIDYGMGNVSSVYNALKCFTDDVKISSAPTDVQAADKLIFPGVGAFKSGYDELVERGLVEPIKEFINSGKPFLGMCLGLHLLFSKSYENGEWEGLDIIKGEVVPFSKDAGLKIPHMGWNTIKSKLENQNCPLLDKVADESYMYFVHSYYPVCEDTEVVCMTTEYGLEFCSMIWKDNIYAVQFHPEKSQTDGLKIIENFVKL
ncbi:MAG: imidazole glycerol phosphate synthase subunit HisH [Candidatus Omnitrophota bacterium]